MRAISLWQPWASAVVLGVKKIETRHWGPKYTGPLAIHAAKRWHAEQQQFAATEVALGRLPQRLPFGAIIGVVELLGWRFAEDVAAQITAIERMYGNYDAGRFAWLLANARALPEPIPFKGHQSFFEVPDDLLHAAATDGR